MKEKKKIELSATEISLIIYAVSAVIVVLAYFSVFAPKMSEASSVESANVGLQTTVSGLEDMVSREAEVIAETAAYNQEVQDIIAKYPVNVPTEKAIKIVQDMQDATGVDVSDLSISVQNLVGSVSNVTVSDVNAQAAAEAAAEEATAEGETVEDTAAATEANGMGYYTLVNLSYKADYDGYKDMIWYINSLTDRTTIPTMSAAVDSETGLISGTVSFRMYYLTGTGKEYVEPELEHQDKGVSNIFGTAVGTLEDGNKTEESTEE